MALLLKKSSKHLRQIKLDNQSFWLNSVCKKMNYCHFFCTDKPCYVSCSHFWNFRFPRTQTLCNKYECMTDEISFFIVFASELKTLFNLHTHASFCYIFLGIFLFFGAGWWSHCVCNNYFLSYVTHQFYCLCVAVFIIVCVSAYAQIYSGVAAQQCSSLYNKKYISHQPLAKL